MEDMGFVAIPAIVVICYLVCEVVKITSLDSKYLPVIAGIFGGALGVAGMYIMPDYPASDFMTAIAIGIVSGLGATGANQIAKITSK